MDAASACDGLFLRVRAEAPIPLHVDLACPAGRTMAVVGPSGCGKSTTLRVVAGLHRVPGAVVRCQGEVWQEGQRFVPTHRRPVGMVFQSYALFPHRSVLANVMATRGVERRRALELLAQVGLEGLEDRLPHQLSGGQRQRVALARALARDPRVLLLDEPFSAVDGPMRRSLHDALRRVRASLAAPCLLVTHDVAEARALAHQLVVMDAGTVLQAGEPEAVLRAPASRRVAEVLGLANVLPAVVVAVGEDGMHLGAGGLALRSAGARRFRPGSSVLWHIPPSEVAVLPEGEPACRYQHGPVVLLEVRDVQVVAPVVRLRLGLPSGEELEAEATHPALRQRPPSPGQQVRVCLPPSAIHVLPAA